MHARAHVHGLGHAPWGSKPLFSFVEAVTKNDILLITNYFRVL